MVKKRDRICRSASKNELNVAFIQFMIFFFLVLLLTLCPYLHLYRFR